MKKERADQQKKRTDQPKKKTVLLYVILNKKELLLHTYITKCIPDLSDQNQNHIFRCADERERREMLNNIKVSGI